MDFATKVESEVITHLYTHARHEDRIRIRLYYPSQKGMIEHEVKSVPVYITGAYWPRALARNFEENIAADCRIRGEEFRPDNLGFQIIFYRD